MGSLNIAIAVVHAVIVYAWILFPAALAWLASTRSAKTVRGGGSHALPPVTVILSAYNEEQHIGDRIRNLQEVDYGAPWRALIGVDGAEDATAATARRAASGDSRVTILDFPENRGKVAVLKDLVSRAQEQGRQGEILVFTDANTHFAPDALERLCAAFSDASVGGVCGRLRLVRPEGGNTEETAYWRAENWLKAKESAVDSCLGANGAIYAIRPSLFWSAIPSNTIIDDFVIGMKVREQNYRMIYEPDAVAEEDLPPAIQHEWKRRVRIGAGNFQALRLCRRSLSPALRVFAWIFWSHKVLRWFTPHLVLTGIGLALAGAASTRPIPGRAVVLGYLGVAMAAVLGSRLERGYRLGHIARGIRYLIAMQAALFAGFLRFCRGNLEGRWQRTARQSGPRGTKAAAG